jgi:uncharacterized membrane protein YidH (DUF202 family)
MAADERGMQAERTRLAWVRTLLAATAATVLIARASDPGAERIAATVLAVLGMALVTVAAMRRRQPLVAPPVLAAAPFVVGCALVGLAALEVAALVVVL